MASQRAERVGRQVLQEISTIVECELADPRLELVTFTSVRMTPDLRTARVYFSCMDAANAEQSRRDCERALMQAGGVLRRELGRRLDLRYVPALHFEYDDSYERADRISRLLEEEKRR